MADKGRGRGDRDSRPKIRTGKQKDPNVGKPGQREIRTTVPKKR